MKASPTLLCIPDISGFTKFMSEIDFELSSKVIPSLLNNIIYSNEIGLRVSEIEGDAVLFYKTGELPSLSSLVNQCKFFYDEFYKQLNLLRANYKNKDGAILIPEILGLKIILHYGKEIGVVPVGKRIKLIGEDVIVAHKLLKNNIKGDEYVLISKELLTQYTPVTIENEFKKGVFHESDIDVEHMGKIHFNYIDLTTLHKN
tara:strand:- start:24373 stop:24978 length:606 start_codon:yes stop_codon:yes gene_type:complete